MKHAECERLLAVYRDLEAAEREEVDRHLAGCAECAALLEAYRRLDQDLRRLPDAPPPRRLGEAWRAAMEREGQPRWSWRRLAGQAEVAARAGLVVALSLVGLLLAYVGTRPGSTLAPGAGPGPTPTLSTPGPGVADILADPPEPGETVELDAYYSGAVSFPFSGGPRPADDQVVCPFNWVQALTDRPFPAMLAVLNGVRGNGLPAGEPWLVAVTPDAAVPGRRTMPQLPYHARLRGHLGEPALAQCDAAERIFVVEKVVTVYEEAGPRTYPATLPEGYDQWPRHHDAALGYSLPYPPDWQVERQDATTVLLRGPQWPDYPVTVRVHEGETRYDQYDPGSTPPILQGQSWSVYEQGWAFGEGAVAGSQHLAGWTVERGEASEATSERTIAAVFSADGHTYELSLAYPLGFDAPQGLLTAYTAMVEGLRFDAAPGPSATAPVRQELGPGPFLSQEEALATIDAGENVELLEAELVSEVEARRRGGACGAYTGHSDGVWLLTVRGTFEGRTRTMLMYVDAVTGDRLCGEEIAPPEAGDFTIYYGDEPGGEVALSTADLISYSAESHEMALTAEAAARLGDLRVPTSGTPFVVCVGDEAIYRGAFFTPLSSTSYDGVVILTILPGTGTARIELGYPGPDYYTGEDPRGDPRILQALERAGKLERTAPAATTTPVPTSALDDLAVDTRAYPSPDGTWTAEVTVATPRVGEGGDRYYTQMKVSRTDGTVAWVPVDEWKVWALGSTDPVPLRWSRDGRYLYFTNRAVPDGCALFVNGWDLQRLDLADGRVTEVMPGSGPWLEISPDETRVAYVGYGERGLVIRDLATGAERGSQFGGPESYDAGHIVWSPDGRALALTVAIDPCLSDNYGDGGVWARSTSIVWADAETLELRALVLRDERRFISLGWADEGTIALEDAKGDPWTLNAATGELVAAG